MNATASKNDVLVDLLQELVVANLGQPVRICKTDGEFLGIFFPFEGPMPSQIPELGDDDEAEFQRRLATIDDSVTPEEMIAMLKKDGVL